MLRALWALVALVMACSHPTPTRTNGHLVVALTIDWEGADLTVEALDALDELRKTLGDAPLTHFISAGYMSKPIAEAEPTIISAVHANDEVAVHLHCWRSLATAAGITPKLVPSFLTGDDKVTEFDNGDAGWDTDLDVYSIPELRALLRKSRELLERTHLPVARTFRAAGYLGTPKVLEALSAEGFTIDSSATDNRQLEEVANTAWAHRLARLWPNIEPATSPFIARTPSGPLLEMPIAAVADYSTAPEIVGILEAADARLRKDPHHDVFVVLAFHLETAPDYARRISESITTVRANPTIAGDLVFTTLDAAAERARTSLPRT
jgi:hypothetical protein